VPAAVEADDAGAVRDWQEEAGVGTSAVVVVVVAAGAAAAAVAGSSGRAG
jgi:hypothetical protein